MQHVLDRQLPFIKVENAAEAHFREAQDAVMGKRTTFPFLGNIEMERNRSDLKISYSVLLSDTGSKLIEKETVRKPMQSQSG